jgi:cytochrome c
MNRMARGERIERKGGVNVMRRKTMVGCLVSGGLLVAAPAQAEGDPEEGRTVFNKCRACHVVDQEQNRVGPHLVGIMGREAGSVEGYNYSAAMKASGIVWDEETIAAYLADPRGYIPNNRMVFVGLRGDEEIQDVIAYLKEATE